MQQIGEVSEYLGMNECTGSAGRWAKRLRTISGFVRTWPGNESTRSVSGLDILERAHVWCRIGRGIPISVQLLL